eukprot:COSAG01_NODE_3118_length_6562_cov_343.759554_1_plen_55_part_00
MRVGQVARAMRVTAAVAPRMASGDPAASKGKSAGGASFGWNLWYLGTIIQVASS